MTNTEAFRQCLFEYRVQNILTDRASYHHWHNLAGKYAAAIIAETC